MASDREIVVHSNARHAREISAPLFGVQAQRLDVDAGAHGVLEIRWRRLAFNRGITLADACAVATPLLAPDGSLIAAISAAVDVSHAHRLDDIGEELKSSVAALGPKYGLNTR